MLKAPNAASLETDIILHFRLTQLMTAYASCLDRGEYARWPAFFTENARYRVMSRENYDAGLPHAAIYCDSRNMIVDRMCAIEKSLFHEKRRQRRLLSGMQWIRSGERIEATTNFLLAECFSGKPVKTTIVGVYSDVLVEEGDALLFADRTCIYDNDAIERSIVIPI